MKKEISFKTFEIPVDINTDERVVEVLGVHLTSTKTILLSIYRPPNGSTKKFLDWLTQVLHYISTIRLSVILLGDFNINLLSDSPESTRLCRLCMSFSLKPAITLPTRPVSNTLIDHIWVPLSLQTKAYIPIFDSSDHYPVHLELFSQYATPLKRRPIYVQRRQLTEDSIRNFQTSLRSIDWQFLESKDVETKWCSFTEILFDNYNTHCPLQWLRITPPNSKQWMSPALKREAAKKNKLYKTFRHSPHNQDAFEEYRLQRKKVSRLIKAAKLSFVTRKLAKATSPKQNWRIYFELIGRPSITPSGPTNWSGRLKNEKGEFVSDTHSVASLFNTHFSSVGERVSTSLGERVFFPTILTDEVVSTFQLSEVNDIEIAVSGKSLRGSLKGAKYGVPSSIFKDILPVILEPLRICINASIRETTFPRILKHAVIVPIFKKGNPEELSNWRPISTLPVVAKLFEKILYDRLHGFVKREGFIHHAQFGFQPGLGTEQALLKYISTITSDLDRGKRCLLISLDVEKAYDSVHHKFLLYKMRHYGIRGPALQLFSSFLKDRSHVTFWKGVTSQPVSPKYGLPQGSILSPILFLIFINDLFYTETPGAFVGYADDTALLFPLSSPSTRDEEQGVSLTLARVHLWFTNNSLSLNHNKTAALLLHNKHACPTIPSTMLLNDCPINTFEAQSLQVLGVVLDSSLKWREQIEKIGTRLAALNALLFKLRMDDFPTLARLRCYKSLVLPVLTYGVIIWGYAPRHLRIIVQRLQNTALRHIKALPPRSSTSTLFKSLGLLSFNELRDRQVNNVIHKERLAVTSRFPEFSPVTTRTTPRLTDTHMLATRHVRTTLRQNTAFFEGIKRYNTLPLVLRQLEQHTIFKKRLRKYLKDGSAS